MPSALSEKSWSSMLRKVSETKLCVICCQENQQFYCVGECDHPICLECGVRLRVICDTNGCPVCRVDLKRVVIVEKSTISNFNLTRNTIGDEHLEQKYGLKFEHATALEATRVILSHVCTLCQGRPTFSDFVQLRDHIRTEHQLFYCDLCVETLKLFSWEHKYYRRDQLNRHNERGDSYDRSHRGHPLCKFCDVRFVDGEQLYKHLRRDHFFCHFCEVEGRNEFYSNVMELKKHFKSEHFICDKGDCKQEPFGVSFRCENELQTHQNCAHSSKKHKRWIPVKSSQLSDYIGDFPPLAHSKPRAELPVPPPSIQMQKAPITKPSIPLASALVPPASASALAPAPVAASADARSAKVVEAAIASSTPKQSFVMIDDDEFVSASERIAAETMEAASAKRDVKPKSIPLSKTSSANDEKIGHLTNGFKKIYDLVLGKPEAADNGTFDNALTKETEKEKDSSKSSPEHVQWNKDSTGDQVRENNKSITSGIDSISANASPNRYVMPRNFDIRNRSLFDRLKACMRQDVDRIETFRKRSLEFQRGRIDAAAFCVWMQVLFDDESTFADLFNDLLCLLPDIDCQQRLRDAFVDGGGRRCDESMKKCPKCGQWLLKMDFFEHMFDAHNK